MSEQVDGQVDPQRDGRVALRVDGYRERVGRYDVVIVGGGPAGLSAAVALGRARRSVLVVDAGEPRNAPAGEVHNFLTRDGTPPAELLAAGRAEVLRYGGEIVTATVTAVRRLDGLLDGAEGGFVVDHSGGTALGRRLLLATGLVDELPDVAGLAGRWGRDVLHCPYCHGWEVRDRAIGVIATGPHAIDQALLWRQWSDDVTLFLHTAEFPPGRRDTPDSGWERLAARGVVVVEGEVTAVEVRDDRLVGVRLADGTEVPRQALVVASRLAARGDLPAGLGLSLSDVSWGDLVLGTRLAADPTGRTDIPGVWVAGNATDPLAQVVMSAASGLRAGAALNGDLVAEDIRRAVAAHRDGRGERGGVPDPGTRDGDLDRAAPGSAV